jgi:hypothetical protein
MRRRPFLKSTLACLPALALPRLEAANLPVVSEFPSAPNHNVDKRMRVLATVAATTVELQVREGDLGPALADTSLRLLLLAELPDGSRRELGVVTHPYQLTVARSAFPAGGWVNLTGEVISGAHFNKFLTNPLHLGSAAVTKVPLRGIHVLSAQLDTGSAEWLMPPARYSETSYRPYVLTTSPSQNGTAPAKWVKETPWGPGMHYAESYPRWRRIGGVVQGEATRASKGTAELGPAIAQNTYFPTYGGPPGVANTTPYATVRGHPSGGRGPQWIELDGHGRFWGYNRDGTVVGMAGYRMPVDNYEIPDETLSTWRMVGEFPDGPLKHPHDFSFDFVDRKYVYVADSDNHRLVRISRHTASVTGQPEDFSKWVVRAWGAAFTHPTSVESTTTGAIYVVDSAGLWSVDRTSGAKTALLTQTGLFWVRALSSGLLCVTDTAGKIFRVNPANRQSTLLADLKQGSQWPIMSVDLTGQIGPRDSLYYVNASALSLWRIDQNGTVNGPGYMTGGGSYTAMGDIQYTQDPLGHYIWNAEVHPEEPYLMVRGFANSMPALIRPMQAGESHLSYHDYYLSGVGRALFQRGTIQGFPWGSRPSFTTLMSTHGHSGLGVKMFDAIQAMPLAERITYIKAGLGGSVARPELVGDHLRGLLYWIWRNSNQFMAGQPLELPPAETETVAPVISNVRVVRSGDRLTWTWRTDRPTLCYVRFADRVPMYRWTPLESSFTTDHTATAAHAGEAVNYQICALATNGVLATGTVNTVGRSNDTTPPRAPMRLR